MGLGLRSVILITSLALSFSVYAQEIVQEKADQLPPVDIVKSAPDEVVLVRGEEQFRIPSPTEEEFQKNISGLTAAEKTIFQARRALILERMLSLFHWRYLKEGKGAMVGNRIVQDQLKSVQRATEASGHHVQQEVLEMFWHELAEKQKLAGGDHIYELNLAHDLVVEKLRGIDKLIHTYAGVVTQPSEIGFSFGMGIGLVAGKKSKIYGGARLLNFNIGIDFKTKSLVFEIYRVKETAAKAITPVVFSTQAIFNAGLYLKNPTYKGTHVGSVPYAPGIPVGASGYANYLEMGAMLGYPPIIFEFSGWISDATRDSLLRLEFTAVRKGFLKIHVGSVVKESLVSVREMVGRWFSPKGGPSCRRVFTASN